MLNIDIFIRDLIMVFECSDCNEEWRLEEFEIVPTDEGNTCVCPSCEEKLDLDEREVFETLTEHREIAMSNLVNEVDLDRDDVVKAVRSLLSREYVFIDKESVKLTEMAR